ncbi:probable vacuolar amino acid transporter YPQ3 [Trichomonascus vanleenenianus]|uniref:PQ-loop repeat-containing protein n=1 Tax=Trichomonascus vanleenenianus TaxID=2268995 RepID=UPI003ECA68B6
MIPALYLDSEAISGITGSISIACWIIVFTPQLYENFQRQSAEGLSLTFVNLWLAGDIFNVIGAILQDVLPTMIILAVYYTLADIVLLIQCLVYNSRMNTPEAVDPKHLSPATPLLDEEVLQHHQYGALVVPIGDEESQAVVVEPPLPRWKAALYNTLVVTSVVASGVIGWYLSSGSKSSDDGPEEPQTMNFWGQVFGWLCAFFYLGSRVPQLLLNFKRKSCEGISFLFFLFACLGNLSYVVSILAKDMSRQYLLINASWLAGSVGTLFLDFIIFCQFWIYQPDYDEDDSSSCDDDDQCDYE